MSNGTLNGIRCNGICNGIQLNGTSNGIRCNGIFNGIRYNGILTVSHKFSLNGKSSECFIQNTRNNETDQWYALL